MNIFYKSVKVTLVIVYLVIVAGALVRMTGSGMGCPDWPKCFGYYIPPTDISTLTWTPNHQYFEGQAIIKSDTLWIAKEDFKSTGTYDASKFKQYTKHDYAIFNPLHTWIEYINRLIGALAGLSTLIMTFLSVKVFNQNKKLTYLSFITLGILLFQGWLGATVVFSVLNPIKITLHMLVALLIVAVLLFIVSESKPADNRIKHHPSFFYGCIFVVAVSLIQIALGTQVRQFVDEYASDVAAGLHTALNNPEISFYVHRTFSWVVLIANIWLFIQNRRLQLGYDRTSWLLIIISLEIVTGLTMYYFQFPFGMQSIHLVGASLMFGIQFHLLLQAAKSKEKVR